MEAIQEPPHSEDNEQAVIGSVLIDPDTFYRLDFLKASHFYTFKNGLVWEAFRKLHEARLPLDYLTLITELERSGNLLDIGGAAYVSQLINSVPTSIHAEGYARTVMTMAVRRGMIASASEIARMAYDLDGNIDEQMARAASSVSNMQIVPKQSLPIGTTASELIDQVSEWSNNPLVGDNVRGLCCHIRPIDKMIGGFERQLLYILAGRPGMGKCLGIGTPVMMYDGTVRAVEKIVEGDLLMGPDSMPREVLSTTHGYGPLYNVIPTKGNLYTVNDQHVLSLRMNGDTGGYKSGEIINVSIDKYFSLSKRHRHHAKGWRAALDFDESEVKLDPYFLGLWLGDGTLVKPGITTEDKEVSSFLYSYAQSLGLTIREESKKTTHAKVYHISSGRTGRSDSNKVLSGLRAYGLLGNKRIPADYKMNSRRVRLELLAGLIDTDGYLVSGCYELVTVSQDLACDYVWLARSLGFSAYKHFSNKTIKATGFSGNYWRLFISGDISEIPVRIARKKAPKRKMNKDVTNVGIRVEPYVNGDYFGFEIDGDGLFLLGDFTVTHNSALAFHIGENVAKSGGRVLIVSIEMSARQVLSRLVSADAMIRWDEVKRGNMTDAQWHIILDKISDLSSLPLYICDSSRITTSKVESEVARLGSLDLVIVDHLGLLDDRGSNGENETTRIGRISWALKQIAKQYSVPVLCVCQLNRGVEARQDKRPVLSDLRQSGDIEQNADAVLMLYRDDYYNQDSDKRNIIEVLPRKLRDGDTSAMAELYFRKEYTRFDEIERRQIE